MTPFGFSTLFHGITCALALRAFPTAIEKQMVKGVYVVAVTLMSVEEFYVSYFSGNKENKDHRQKARFLKVECDAP